MPLVKQITQVQSKNHGFRFKAGFIVFKAAKTANKK
jgi:hypothetical protein